MFSIQCKYRIFLDPASVDLSEKHKKMSEDSLIDEVEIEINAEEMKTQTIHPISFNFAISENSNDEEQEYKMKHFSSDKVENETNVDEMKIQTMYKMVEDCHCTVSGMDVSKKVLYLTNKQANLFDEQTMARCIQALDIGDPKFVINLLEAFGVYSQMKLSLKEAENDPDAHYKASDLSHSEISPIDEREVESQILLL